MKSIVADETMLREPVERGVRLVAISLLDDARQAGDKLTNLANELRDGVTAADDALHDFRVAVRRVRSWVRAFKPWLQDDMSRKRRRRLSGIAEATRAARDAAVHLEWLRKERPELTARQRVGQTWLSERLVAQRTEGADAAFEAAADFATMVPKLTRRLEFYRAAVSQPERAERFGAIFAERLLKESEELRERLAAVHRFTDVKEAHRARIGTKNLRYVAEPLAKRFWTLSVWEDDAALCAFVGTPPHAQAMRVMTPHMAPTEFVRWTLPGLALPPTWADAVRRAGRGCPAAG